MSNNESVTVVVPAYNSARFLHDTVASVRQQSIGIVELIVVDDGSTDDTLAILHELGATTISLSNGGAGRARRAGLAQSTSDFVMFLDADDRLRPNALALLLDAARSSGAPVVSGQLVNIVQAEFAKTDPLTSTPYPGPLSSGTLLMRDVFEPVGPFSDDNMSWLRWIAAAKRLRVPMAVIDAVVVDRRVHDANISRSALTDGGYFSVLREHLRHVSGGRIVRSQGTVDPERS